jgi:hypothetical protein
MKYCSGERSAKGLMGRVLLNCETPGSSWSISCNKVRFLASCDISLSFTIFCYLFFCIDNVNILLSSGREFMLLFLVYMTYALFKVLEYNLTCQQPKR